MGPLVGALIGGGASGIFGGAGGGGLMGAFMANMLSGGGGLGGLLSNLFGGSQHAGANDQTNQMLGDIKDMLGELLDQKGGSHGCGSHGAMESAGSGCGSAMMPDHGSHGCGGTEPPGSSCDSHAHDCGDVEDHVGDCGQDDEPDCGGWAGSCGGPELIHHYRIEEGTLIHDH